ncbi:hypothetical protein DN069_30830 [Streptacidiphilus pinicola]|uniref:RNA polymerase sigma-70 region 2 domain-containing protein n=1 Tax=Streptacidiphilus pinicola TaxID=2219663 RepID=A0A2X0IA50_9ACTN|nr:hypothetical protein DN069_30830 [Streptacidiphilus pinicola]
MPRTLAATSGVDVTDSLLGDTYGQDVRTRRGAGGVEEVDTAGAADVVAGLYRRYRSPLVWHLRARGATEAEAHDAVQEAFVAALRAGSIDDPAAWYGWLRTVAARCLARARSAAGGGRVAVETMAPATCRTGRRRRRVSPTPSRPGPARATCSRCSTHCHRVRARSSASTWRASARRRSPRNWGWNSRRSGRTSPARAAHCGP